MPPIESYSSIDRVIARTEVFAKEVAAAFREEVVTIVLYGGLARGEFNPLSSDVNLMLVFREITLQTLEKLAPLLERVRLEIEVNPLCVTEGELEDSAEVFAIKFLDIQRQHRILHGKNISIQIAPPRDRLKRQCQRELTNLKLRLRLFFLRQHRPEQIEGTLVQTLPAYSTVLRVLEELRCDASPTSKDGLVDYALASGLDVKTYQGLLELKEGKSTPSASELHRLYGAYMELVAKTADLAETIS